MGHNMRHGKKVIWLLTIMLVASNTWWAYQLVGAGVSATYRDQSLQEHRGALAQALAILPVAVRIESTRTEVIEAAQQSAPNGEPFEKDGYTWIGHIGLRFDQNGRLAELVPSWSPF